VIIPNKMSQCSQFVRWAREQWTVVRSFVFFLLSSTAMFGGEIRQEMRAFGEEKKKTKSEGITSIEYWRRKGKNEERTDALNTCVKKRRESFTFLLSEKYDRLLLRIENICYMNQWIQSMNLFFGCIEINDTIMK
jgi:hypothetical protein